ncbi:RNA polymerase sigma factor [Ornithobacterium rhinotracheale]|uniref:RNA polymerase sigma factor n=1 Tax=Ornithobacterium rhinotracheale TaxID=28251 RepID=UPI002158AD47|nr:sigma-70 family RNA polymerase sigma factor [Ornithobacterium rhinotracheale]UVD87951.1 sigma-70 family RNA polymerase sigma factor [Ornithobacterium rhinotracheale]
MKKTELITLIEDCKKGKQSAQTTLMNLLWDKVHYYVLSKIQNKADAEDISIKTFTKVFQKLKLYNEDFDFITWVRAIAHNTMIDYIRKKPELNISIDDELCNVDLSSAVPSPEQSLILEQSAEELMHHVAKLPAIYQEIIRLRYLEEKTYNQIAQELNLSLSNVKVRLLRAKALLEESMKNK